MILMFSLFNSIRRFVHIQSDHLRVERKLTLEQLSAEVGISKSALGKYESDNGKDISPYSILLLADYYGVSCDYLMGRTETKNHPNTALHELHLSDASIDVFPLQFLISLAGAYTNCKRQLALPALKI